MSVPARKRLCSPIKCRPFIKWAGGKTQLLDELVRRVPDEFNRYFEPFVGGGALYFALQPEDAYLSDVNEELINAYQIVKGDCEGLIKDLSKHVYEKEYYYKVRDIDRTSAYGGWNKIRRASRLIYLNKTCFNGLYRVNSKGHFNVPFGSYKDPKICDADNLLACSVVLQSATIVSDSFEAISDKASKGDFVYFDPPYMPLTDTANFTGYSKGGFGERQQIALRDLCRELNGKGVKFMVSNSSAPLILELYEEFNLQLVEASRAINSKAAKRGKINEAIITNY